MANADRTWGSRRISKQAKYGRFEAQQALNGKMKIFLL
jgi:hypothetical protein